MTRLAPVILYAFAAVWLLQQFWLAAGLARMKPGKVADEARAMIGGAV